MTDGHKCWSDQASHSFINRSCMMQLDQILRSSIKINSLKMSVFPVKPSLWLNFVQQQHSKYLYQAHCLFLLSKIPNRKMIQKMVKDSPKSRLRVPTQSGTSGGAPTVLIQWYPLVYPMPFFFVGENLRHHCRKMAKTSNILVHVRTLITFINIGRIKT